MKRFCLAVAVSIAALVATALPAAAQGACGPAFDTGGNGWCADGVSFRAWQVEDAIELKWAVSEGTATIAIERQVAGDSAAPVVVATSTAAGEYTLLDADLAAGPSYVYQVLRDGEAIGDPIEAGISVSRTDPGDGAGSFRVYIPLTI